MKIERKQQITKLMAGMKSLRTQDMEKASGRIACVNDAMRANPGDIRAAAVLILVAARNAYEVAQQNADILNDVANIIDEDNKEGK